MISTIKKMILQLPQPLLDLTPPCHFQNLQTILNNPTILKKSITTFQQDGFVVFPNVLDDTVVDQLNERLAAILGGEYDRGMSPDKEFPSTRRIPNVMFSSSHLEGEGDEQSMINIRDVRKSSTCHLDIYGNSQKVPAKKEKFNRQPNNNNHDKVIQLINVHKCDKLFRSLATNSSLGNLIAHLTQWIHHEHCGCGVRLAQDQIWAKPPLSTPLTYHRDSPYFMFTPSNVVTVWIALDDMDEKIGPLEYVRGSHRWTKETLNNSTNSQKENDNLPGVNNTGVRSSKQASGTASRFFQSDRGVTLLRRAASEAGVKDNDIEIVSMAGMRRGGISIHDGNTWHGSGSNRSKVRPRRGIGMHFVPSNVKFTKEALKSKLWKMYVSTKNEVERPDDYNDDVPIMVIGEVNDEDFPVVYQIRKKHV